MGFDMNSGYSGWSMSKNAVAAYHDGEMPKSKWTKKAILAARKAAREQAEAEHRARIEAAEAKAAAEAAWAAERGYERRSVLHYAELHPEECETVLNRKGEPIVRIVHGEKTYVYEKAKAGSIILYWWADEWKEN